MEKTDELISLQSLEGRLLFAVPKSESTRLSFLDNICD